MSAIEKQPRGSAIPPQARVLRTRQLASGARVEDTSCFGDEVWELGPAQHQKHATTLKLDFAHVPADFRLVAKELFYALLTSDLPPGEPSMSIVTIRGMLSNVGEFLRWAQQERQLASLGAFTPQDAEAWDQYVKARKLAEMTKAFKWRTMCLFWVYRRKLTVDAVTFDPASVVEPISYEGGRGENSTARIPEQVISPLLVWALWWVQVAAVDVLGALAEWAALNAQTEVNRKLRGERAEDTRAALTAVLDRYRAEGRALPFGISHVNYSHLAREAGCATGSFSKGRVAHLIEQAVGELGVDDGSYLRHTVRAELDGRPFISRIAYGDLPDYVRLLTTAAYIVVSYLSGMRESEVKHLRRGCLKTWADQDAGVVRRWVTSLAFKGEDDPTGVEATWVVIEAVAKAVEVLEALQHPDEDLLFAVHYSSPFYKQVTRGQAVRNQTTIVALHAFGDWINEYCAAHGRADVVPLVDGRKWRFTTRQFRRTLAWFIARQSGGSIAGALQFRHLRIQVFEGYAGTSESGFRAEVEAEEALARGEKLGDLIVNHDHYRLVGPAAAEAERRLAEFERQVRFDGKVITDPKRLARHMERHDPHIYPGEFVTCVHNPDRALCRREGQDGPSLPDCQPLACRNVALSTENVEAFVSYLATIDKTLAKGEVLAPFLRHRLQQRRREIAEFLAEHTDPPQSPEAA